MDRARGEFTLVPTFRLPTLIHTRSANSKWLYELSNINPLWVNPKDASRLGLASGDLARISTRIGYFVNRVWVTEGIRPGVVACSHHLGRWRIPGMPGTDRWASAQVEIDAPAGRRWVVRRVGDVAPFDSDDPDSRRVWWSDGGVHQNLTFPVQPDPISGMHCWHQKVTVQRAPEGDAYGDITVDTEKAAEVYREWVALTGDRPHPQNLRRPLHFARAVRPADTAYYLP
jgi:anaerobic selenocysteine-containing dehydrogenase